MYVVVWAQPSELMWLESRDSSQPITTPDFDPLANQIAIHKLSRLSTAEYKVTHIKENAALGVF